jgi:Mrp family chromosome partitioning ATPase
VIKIKKILTALGMPNINNKLIAKDIVIKSNDIQYKEGILEYLETDKEIDYIIIFENLPGNISTQDLISKIKEINNEIKVIIYSNNENKDNNKIYYNVYKIIYKIEDIKQIEEFKENRKSRNNNQNMKNNENNNKDMKNNKNYNQKIKINKGNYQDNINFHKKPTYIQRSLANKALDNDIDRNGKVISIAGTTGIGKSTFSILFAQNIKGNKKLVIDFDVLNNSIHTILGINQYSKEIQKKIKENRKEELNFDYINIKDFITKTKYGIDIISGMNLIFGSDNQNSPTKIRNIIKKAKSEYDVVVIDTSSYGLLDYTKEIFKVSDNIVFISGANILEIKKTKKLLKIYEEEWGIERRKIQIMFNKYTEESIDTQVLRNIFNNYNVLGKIKLRDYYDFIINQRKSGIKRINDEIKIIEERLEQSNIRIKQIKNRI